MATHQVSLHHRVDVHDHRHDLVHVHLRLHEMLRGHASGPERIVTRGAGRDGGVEPDRAVVHLYLQLLVVAQHAADERTHVHLVVRDRGREGVRVRVRGAPHGDVDSHLRVLVDLYLQLAVHVFVRVRNHGDVRDRPLVLVAVPRLCERPASRMCRRACRRTRSGPRPQSSTRSRP